MQTAKPSESINQEYEMISLEMRLSVVTLFTNESPRYLAYWLLNILGSYIITFISNW